MQDISINPKIVRLPINPMPNLPIIPAAILCAAALLAPVCLPWPAALVASCAFVWAAINSLLEHNPRQYRTTTEEDHE